MSIYKILCVLVLSFFLASCIYLAAEDTPAQKKSTVLRFVIQSGDSAVVTVYNLIGNVIVQKSFYESGLHRISIEIFNLPAGIYLVRIKKPHSTIMKKVYVIP
jgi:cell division protein YceG involved in septum cleavage